MLRRWYEFDLNRNGIADIREPWLYRLGVQLIGFAVRRFASPHTLAARHLDTARELADKTLNAWEASRPRVDVIPSSLASEAPTLPLPPPEGPAPRE